MASALRYYRKPDSSPPKILLKGPVVKIKAGVTGDEHYIHKALLCHYSQYFDAALNGPFKEGHSQEVDLDEENAALFERVYHWLYTGTFQFKHEGRNSPFRDMHVDLWLLAERRGMPALQNAVLYTYHHIVLDDYRVTSTALAKLFADSPPTAKARNWVTEILVVVGGRELVDGVSQALAKSGREAERVLFLEIMAHRLLEIADSGGRKLEKSARQAAGRATRMCSFHEHEAGKDCKALMEEDEKMREPGAGAKKAT